MPDPEQPGAWLFARPTGGIRWGLERTEALLAGVGNPHRRFRSLHVGGTNGKGSVSALCDAVLRAHVPGRSVGLYTSPHLVSFAERIRIDGEPVERDLLLACEARLRAAIETSGASFFEATTAIALLCFAEAGVEVAVVEVGLGGRLDSTNVISPVACAVTNVALDHTEYLGTDRSQIAAEKAGIIKPGVPVVCGETDSTLVEVFRERATAMAAPFHAVAADAVTEVALAPTGTDFRLRSAHWGERRVRAALVGVHQARNAALAAELLAVLPEELRPEWSAVARGFAGVRWPGRFQVEQLGTQTWVFDVAHNVDGAAALCATLDALDLPRPLVLLASVLRDKDWRTMLPPLLERSQAVILTVPPSAPESRRWDPEGVAAELDVPAGVAVRVIPDFAAALRRAETLAPHGTVLVTGSVHTVGDALGALTPRPPLPTTPGRGGAHRRRVRVRGTTAELDSRARALRREATRAEEVLWEALRLRPGGLKFRRQHAVGRYILDFYCPSVRLAVELDGGVHDSPDQAARDVARDEDLARGGIRVLRIPNEDVLRDVKAVVARITRAAQDVLPPPPGFGGGGPGG